LIKSGSKPRLHGTQIWRSTFTLMEYLTDHPLKLGQCIMEIGCGWGLAGIYSAKRFSADVLLTDADEQVFPYAMTHAKLNGVPVRTEHVRFEGIQDHHLREHDVLMGSDICFWPELGTQLRRLIERALCSGIRTILLADPGRASFMQLANYCQRHFGATMIPRQAVTRAGSSGYVLVIKQDWVMDARPWATEAH
jgi:predicted nicotinamide N-methyase